MPDPRRWALGADRADGAAAAAAGDDDPGAPLQDDAASSSSAPDRLQASARKPPAVVRPEASGPPESTDAADGCEMAAVDRGRRPSSPSPSPSPGARAAEETDRLAFHRYWQTRRAAAPDVVPVTLRMSRAKVQVHCWPDDRRPAGALLHDLLSRVAGSGPRRWKTILHTGPRDLEFAPGTITLLLGPPCSGSTSFLRALAGHLHADTDYEVRGVSYNGVPVEAGPAAAAPATVSYVGDRDVHLPMLTVRQTVQFAAACRSRADGPDHVAALLDALGLRPVADGPVGTPGASGISSGERRRLSLAEGWGSGTRVLLVDRLSDGLDSASTVAVLQHLRTWARLMQSTVVVSLLQPPAEVFGFCDQVVVLREGLVVFAGPPHHAQDLADLADLDGADALGGAAAARAPLTKGWRRSWLLAYCRRLRQSHGYGRPVVSQLGLCLWRDALCELWPLLVVRGLVLHSITGLLVASVWTTLPLDSVSLNERDSLLFLTCVSCAVATQGKTTQFMALKEIYQKQQPAHLYRSGVFWLASTVFQAVGGLLETGCFLGPVYTLCQLAPRPGAFGQTWMAMYLLNLVCSLLFRGCAIVSPSLSVACTLAALLQVLLFLYSGFFVGWLDVPIWWDWMTWVSPQSYAYSILMKVQYTGLVIECYTAGCANITGLQHLEQLGDDTPLEQDFIILGGMLAAAWLLGWGLLWALPPPRTVPRPPGGAASAGIKIPFFDTIPVVVSWSDVGFVAGARRRFRRPARRLLEGISGIVRPGQLLAILGPSGCGKSTLLDVLAGRPPRGSLEGEVRVNGALRDQASFRQVCGYVEQRPAHCGVFTVLESLNFSAKLRLASSMPRAHRLRYCGMVAEALHLLPLLGTRVDALSHDQRPYLALAVELVANPSVLFLDEPTTGLDAHQALFLMRAVRAISRRLGIATLATIHQPSALLFREFTSVMVLGPGGWMAYFGAAGQAVLNHFQGLPASQNVAAQCSNPAHWVLEVVARAPAAAPAGDRRPSLADAYCQSPQFATLQRDLLHYGAPFGHDLAFSTRYPTGFCVQLRVLLRRSAKVSWRSPEYVLFRTVLLIAFALIFGSVYWQMDYSWHHTTTRLSFCYVTTFYCGFAFLYSAMAVLMAQRPVYYRERAAGAYSCVAYGLASMLAEIPYFTVNSVAFLGIVWPLSGMVDSAPQWGRHLLAFWLFIWLCTFLGHLLAAITPNLEAAFVVTPVLACWFSALSGFYLPPAAIPAWWQWAYWLNPFQYTFNTLATNMLHGRVYCPGAPANGTVAGAVNGSYYELTCPFPTTDAFLSFSGFREDPAVWFLWDQLAVLAYIVACAVGTFLALKYVRYPGR